MTEKSAISIEDLLQFTVKHKASDLHISAGMPAMIRVDGENDTHQHAGDESSSRASAHL
mgnify:CR=1 FL=1